MIIRRLGGPPCDDPLFMLRRSSKSAFNPDALVFPGGALEAEDGPPGSDEAFDRAARRETIEESAIDLTRCDLVWFDTWLTPVGERRRFMTRFYLAMIDADQGHEAEADGVEVHDGRWATPAEFLSDCDSGSVDLPPPTLSTLMLLSERGWPWFIESAAEPPREPIMPKMELADRSITVVMPHDPEYASLPGDSMPAPARASVHAKRFLRRENRWIVIDA